MRISERKMTGWVILLVWGILGCAAILRGRPSFWRSSLYNFVPFADMAACVKGVLQGALPVRFLFCWGYQLLSGILLGIGISLVGKREGCCSVLRTLSLSILVFATLNAARYLLHLGFFDVTDILVSALGMTAGVYAMSASASPRN